MADIITVTSISQEAKKYQEQLRLLPYYIMAPELANAGIQLLQVAGIDVITQAQRRGGLLKPYVPGAAITNEDDLMKFREAELAPKTAYISMIDNIKNYNAKKLMNVPAPGTALNQTKKHPFEKLISANVVKTATEDVLDALWSAERNPAVLTPQGTFDGYDKKIDDFITATDISAANGNLKPTGAIVAPVDETDYTAVNTLVDFVRAAHSFLRKNGVLYITHNVYLFAIDALENKFKYKDWDLNGLQRYINEKAKAKITLVVSEHMGTGDRIELTIPGNFHFGMDTMGDVEFVQIRNPFEDPNIVQFWLQADFGARIVSIHEKEFQVNDGTPVSVELAGDYQ